MMKRGCVDRRVDDSTIPAWNYKWITEVDEEKYWYIPEHDEIFEEVLFTKYLYSVSILSTFLLN